MKCVVCKLGDTREGHTTVTLEREGAALVVRKVPAQVCANCGEAYVSADVTKTPPVRSRSLARWRRGGHPRIRRHPRVVAGSSRHLRRSCSGEFISPSLSLL